MHLVKLEKYYVLYDFLRLKKIGWLAEDYTFNVDVRLYLIYKKEK